MNLHFYSGHRWILCWASELVSLFFNTTIYSTGEKGVVLKWGPLWNPVQVKAMGTGERFVALLLTWSFNSVMNLATMHVTSRCHAKVAKMHQEWRQLSCRLARRSGRRGRHYNRRQPDAGLQPETGLQCWGVRRSGFFGETTSSERVTNLASSTNKHRVSDWFRYANGTLNCSAFLHPVCFRSMTTWNPKCFGIVVPCASGQRRLELSTQHDQGIMWPVSYTHLTLPTIYSV